MVDEKGGRGRGTEEWFRCGSDITLAADIRKSKGRYAFPQASTPEPELQKLPLMILENLC